MVVTSAFEGREATTTTNLKLLKARREGVRFLSIYSSPPNSILSTPPDLHHKLLTYVLSRQPNQAVEIETGNSQDYWTQSLSSSTLEQLAIEALIYQGVTHLSNQENYQNVHSLPKVYN